MCGPERGVPSGGHSCVRRVGVHTRGAGILDARLIEQTELELEGENPPYCLIDPCLGDSARLDIVQDCRLPLIRVGHEHGHVDARVHRLGDGRGQIRHDVVGTPQRLHVLVIADHDALEMHLVAEDVGQKVMRPCGRNAVDGTGVDHHGARSGVNTARIGRQDHALQIAQREQGLVAVMPVDRLRVPGEVLDGCRHIQRVRRTWGLQSLHIGRSHGCRQRRLLSPGLVRAAPPVVAGEILNGGKVPHPPGGSQRVGRRDAAGSGGRRIPGRAHPDRLRVQRRLPGMPEAVHRVDSEDQRDVQAGVFDRVLLDHVVLVGPVEAGIARAPGAGRVRRVVRAARQHRAGVIVDEHGLHARRVRHGEALAAARVRRTGQVADELLVHLADLLLDRHPVEQVVDAVVDRGLLIEVAWRAPGGRGGRHGQGYERDRGDCNPGHKQGATHRLLLSSDVRGVTPGGSPRATAAATMSCPETKLRRLPSRCASRSGGWTLQPPPLSVPPDRIRKRQGQAASRTADPARGGRGCLA